jgi:hypothetical protein
MIGPQKKWFECGSVARPASTLKLLRRLVDLVRFAPRDLFHAMEAPDNELQPLRLGTKDLRMRDLAHIWHVVVRDMGSGRVPLSDNATFRPQAFRCG